MKNKHYLFVYGTLMKQSSHPMAAFVLSNCSFIGKATIPGELYQISWYPGALYIPDSVSVVEGDLYELNEGVDMLRFFTHLDEYEGVGSQFPIPNEYRRELVSAEVTDGVITPSWMYVYNWPVSADQRIDRFV